MKLAALFWCYKAPELCADRLRLLREHDPEVTIYVLFGGDPGDAAAFRERLGVEVDDFYVFDDPPPPGCEPEAQSFRGGQHWKYYYGDLMFAAWHRDRGRHLEWDTVAVIQWDMLVYGPLSEVFACLEEGQALFSGLRPIHEVADRWAWVAPSQPREHEMYQSFLAHLQERYDYRADPLGYVAVVTCLPRVFLERFCEIERPELGFLEYRLPMYAQVFDVELCREHPFQPWWGAVEPYSPTHVLRARPLEISAGVMRANLRRPDGARVFHPYWRAAPRGALGWAKAMLGSWKRGLTNDRDLYR